MKVLIQWSKQDPDGWEEVNIMQLNHWRNLPKKAEPKGGEVIDNEKGWIYDINVQGVLLGAADHYSIRPILGGGIEVMRWDDDLEDMESPIQRFAQVWSFYRPRQDHRYGGQINTHQLLVVYTDDPQKIQAWVGRTTSGGPVIVKSWAEFEQPKAEDTLHGIWLSDENSEHHRAKQRESIHGWQEWLT